MFNSKLIPLALLVLSPAVFAQVPLGAGGQMQQIPPTPTTPSTPPAIEIRPGSAPIESAPDTAKITVNRLELSGATLYPEASLIELTGFVPGSALSLADLQGMAAKITSFYRQNGYFVAQAYLPAQDINNGVVTLAIIEGHYGQVTLNNQSRVSDDLAYRLMDGLQSGDTVATAPLEHRLLLLSDLPGVKVSSTLVPGATLGTSDLMVDLKPWPFVSGSVDADNAGNRYTGSNRIGATVNFNEPLGRGDVATLRALTSGAGLNYLRGSYQMQFGKATAGVAYSALRYELGQEFAALQAHGSAQVASLYGSYPLIRSRDTNLSATWAMDAKRFQDKVDSTASVADKKAQVLTASLYGNQRDNLGDGGQSAYSLAVSAGNIDLQTPAVQALDAVTAQSQGNFNKLAFTLSRLQRVNDAVSLSAAINGQLASKNLDVSEKMELGGMYGVRAYPEGEAYGDQGYVLSLEARWLLPKLSDRLPGQVQLVGFIDTGRITLHKNPWAAGQNQRTLSGAGIGVNWFESGNFMVRAYYAFKLGSEAATSAPDANGRFWIQAVKYF
ncbi:MAG: polypeptide-transport-associated domain-containing protein [Comamonadaceae bacterium]|nr:MAG: polypeptide-transport-associated domain-containing protein [Comamonadaceae bacterium]